jgi:hypothetical protein
MGAAATKTTVCLDERLHRCQRRMQLKGQLERRIHDSIVDGDPAEAIGIPPSPACGLPATANEGRAQ